MPYKKPFIEKIYCSEPDLIDYDNEIFQLNELNLLANHFVDSHKLNKKYKNLTFDDYNKIISLFCKTNIKYGKVLMDVETFLWYDDSIKNVQSKLYTLGYEVVSCINSFDDNQKINNIRGDLRIFSKNGTSLKLSEKIQDITAIWNDNLKGWIAKFGTNDPNLFIKIIPKPIMGFYLYDLV